MERDITRRDFLNGVGVAITGSLASASPLRVFGLEAAAAAYPPALTGLRGSHDGSWEVAHEMREGKSWDVRSDTGELYDLVVVGGGVSGLAAAYFFRKEAGPGARILILDNHDDFGGHAKRNELRHGKAPSHRLRRKPVDRHSVGLQPGVDGSPARARSRPRSLPYRVRRATSIAIWVSGERSSSTARRSEWIGWCGGARHRGKNSPRPFRSRSPPAGSGSAK